MYDLFTLGLLFHVYPFVSHDLFAFMIFFPGFVLRAGGLKWEPQMYIPYGYVRGFYTTIRRSGGITLIIIGRAKLFSILSDS